jgi:hypothetical protein
MAAPGRPPSVRAGRVVAALTLCGLLAPAAAGDDRDSAILASLAVQTAMQQAREHLLHHNSKAAVEVLEGQLPRIDGNQNYLVLLKNAYRAYVRELRLANQEALAQVYLKRLTILEPGAAAETKAAPPTAPPTPVVTAVPTQPPAGRIIARGCLEEETDPFRRPPAKPGSPARDLLERAEKEFGRRNYHEAGMLYARAHEIDQQLGPDSRERWAYCKLHGVVEQLNCAPAAAVIPGLAAEVRKAQELAPRLRYANDLLAEIEKRRRGAGHDGGREAKPEPPAAVRHGGPTADGWYFAETTNFRVHYKQSRELAEQAARVAEYTRTAMQRKWFSHGGANWSPRCDIYLYATAQNYSRATGAPESSPGHSSFNSEYGRVLSRRIDLHTDDPNLLRAVLPHEATHAVLVGNFGGHQVPRWADEGMAILSEPRDKITPHLQNLPQHRQDGQLFSLHQLVHMTDYPEPQYIGAFYAQSVSLVDFLVKMRGAPVFVQFVRDGLRGDYESSLQRNYGYRDFAELEGRWVQYVFGEGASPDGLARRGR